jgi:hypothetical protein
MLFPILLFIAVIIINLTTSFYVIFTLVSLLKALTYSLDDPVKELLYIPTSNNIKFKAKAWIDVFGARLAKGLGSVITRLSYGDSHKLKKIAEIPTITISILLIIIAWLAGIQFDKNISENIIVGDENHNNNQLNKENKNINTLKTQNLCRNGLYPGDVGYDGYDLHLFDGVFTDDDEDDDLLSISSSNSNNKYNTNSMKSFNISSGNSNMSPSKLNKGYSSRNQSHNNTEFGNRRRTQSSDI